MPATAPQAHRPRLRWALLLVVATLAGCGSAPKRGGYYLDDGPGTPPPNLDRIADAVPRDEPLHRPSTRPYTVLGRTYTPFTESRRYRARGLASWYGKRYHGQKTSSGEIYDMYAMSAAHTVLPLPSYARVTNLENGRSTVVRINDRGPFRDGRLIDLSYAAAYKLGFVDQGSAQVEVESILPGQASALPEVAEAPSAPPASAPVAREEAGIYVQLGAFSVAGNADAFARHMRAELDWLRDDPAVYHRGGLYRVHAGPYADRQAAERDAERIRQALGLKPIVIER
jgi:rare lipoprotein A